jgi:Na+/melibiose symporter-like transporter
MEHMPPALTGSTKLWYGLGQAAEGLKNEAYAVFLLFYYTSVIGLSGALAGQAILIALLFDAITDPLVGAWSDRLETRWGRRHPMLFASAVPLPIFFYLTFAPPAGMSQFGLFAWLATFAVLTRGAMTLFHVPHLALGAELSTEFDERSRIVTVQMVFSRIGAAIAGLLGFLVYLRPTEAFADGRFNADAYPPFALSLSVLMFFCVILSAWMTRSRIPHLTPPDPETLSEHALGAMVRGMNEAMRLTSFRSLFLGTLVMFVAWGVTTSLGLHLATYFWRVSTTELIIWGVAAGTGIFGGLGYWLQQTTVTDKKTVFMRGGILFLVATVVPPFLVIAGFWPDRAHWAYLPLYVLTTGLIGNFGIAATMVTGRSMMADVTDEDELANGRRREGIFFGATSFAAKACFGIGSLIAGFVFDFVGLAHGMTVEDAPDTVVRDLGLTLCLSLLVMVGLSLAIFSRYDLTRGRCGEIREGLDARDAERVA